MSRLYLLVFLLFSTLFLWGQNSAESVSVTGTILGGAEGPALPYATVIAYETADSSMIANALTADDGSFKLSLTAGNYYLKITYVGYEDKYVSDLKVTGEEGTLELGKLIMPAAGVALEEVEVRAERSQMELKLDRRVFNVGKDLANAGNNAADILDRVPSVSVDPEGNVSLRGSQGVRILVNGKPSGLLSAGETDALLQMQGDIIESVEVITNPSARYEAEGEAGIINIILKKEKDKGVNGSFGATVGYPQNFGANYNLNLRSSNFNFFSNFGIDYRRAPGGGESVRRFFNEDGELTDFFISETDQIRGGLGGYLQGGADWNINEQNLLTAAILYRVGRDDNDATVTYRDLEADGSLLRETLREVEELEDEHNLEASLDYTRTFDEEDREWTFNFKYILDDDTEIADYVQTATDSQNPLLQRSSNTEDEINWLFQTDYVHPLGEKSKLEGGVRIALRTVNNDFTVEEEQPSGDFVALDNFDDQLRYTENIYAAYVIGAHEWNSFSFQGGLRMEISDIEPALLESGVTNPQFYTNLFPSASISYEFTAEDQLQASYSRRLSRPYFRRLLPFSNFNDPRNNRIGNPNLLPEFTDSYELGHLHYFPSGSLLSSVYYRRTTGVIERIVIPADDGTSIVYPVNLSVRNSYGVEFSFSYDLTDWWSLNTDWNFFRSLVNGEFEGTDYSADILAWGGGINTQIDIGDRCKIQPSFDYNGPRNTTQGRRLAIYSFDLAASLDIFEGKGTLTLAGRDLFNTRIWRTVVDLPELQAETSFQWRRRQSVVLTFNYRLNQDPKEGRSSSRGGRN